MDNMISFKKDERGEARDGIRQTGGGWGGKLKDLMNFRRCLERCGWTKTLIFAAVIFVLFCVTFRYIESQTKWRAVFLTNNQVYFGRFLQIPFWPTARLTDIYYLQVSQPLQPQAENQSAPQVKVIKLGGEIHGPESAMQIPVGQILFWEDLRSDSPVVKAIESSS